MHVLCIRPKRYDLVDEYNRKMKESVNSEVLGLAEVAYTADRLSE